MSEFEPQIPNNLKNETENLGLVDRALLDFQKDENIMPVYLAEVFEGGSFGNFTQLQKSIEGTYLSKDKKGKKFKEIGEKNYLEMFEMIKKAFWLYFEEKNLRDYKGSNKDILKESAYAIMEEKNNVSVDEMRNGKEKLFNSLENLFLRSWEKYKEYCLRSGKDSLDGGQSSEKRENFMDNETNPDQGWTTKEPERQKAAAGELPWRDEIEEEREKN